MKFILMLSLVVAQAAHAVTSKHHASSPVEIHVALCEDRMHDVFEKLDIDTDEPDEREVSYSDSADRRFLAQGLVVRTRKSKITVKIKVNSLDRIDERFFDDDDFKCEYDRSGFTLSLNCSLDSKDGFTRKQAALARLNVPTFRESDLREFGPAEDSVWKEIETDVGTLSFERYQFPNGDSILELSTRVDLDDEPQTSSRLQTYLATHAVRVCPDQMSKTKSFFAHF